MLRVAGTRLITLVLRGKFLLSLFNVLHFQSSVRIYNGIEWLQSVAFSAL